MASRPKKRSSTSLSPVKGARVEKSSATVKKPSKNKDGSSHRSPTTIFGPNAVTRYLRIPQTGNITGVELSVFLPELLRTPGILLRFFENGVDAQALSRISNWFRAKVKNHTPATAANAMRHITQSTMRCYFEDEKWTETRHKAGDYSKDGQAWDHDNLTFSGVKNYCENNPKAGRHNRAPIDNVRFASFAADVVVFPSGDDELDLTRCVKAAVANKDLPLMFPRDYGYLTWLLGGPQIVRPAHRDNQLFNRWKLVTWAETPSARQVQAALDLTQHRFTPAQRTATEDYLQQLASAKQPARAQFRRLVQMPTQPGFSRPQVPSNIGPLQSPKSALLGRIMSSPEADLVHALTKINEDEMGALYISCLASHGIVPSRSCNKYTSTPDVIHGFFGTDCSVHGSVLPAAHRAVITLPSSDFSSINIAVDDVESRPSSPFDTHLRYENSPNFSVDISLIDPEILKKCDSEMAGFFNQGNDRAPVQDDADDHDFDPLDDVEEDLVQEKKASKRER